MVRLSVFAICLVSVLAFNFLERSNAAPKPKVDSNFVHNFTDFLNANRDIQLQELEKEVIYDGSSSRVSIVYRFGNRRHGDTLMATESGSQNFGKPQDVRLNLVYPKSEQNAVINYIEIFAVQSTKSGRAYIVYGGIGQRQVSIVVEAHDTLYWQYTVDVYGRF